MHARDREGSGDRSEAMRELTQAYIERMHTNEPAHSWPVE